MNLLEDRIISFLAILESAEWQERVAMFEAIKDKYCIHCGFLQPEFFGCYCMDDE